MRKSESAKKWFLFVSSIWIVLAQGCQIKPSPFGITESQLQVDSDSQSVTVNSDSDTHTEFQQDTESETESETGTETETQTDVACLNAGVNFITGSEWDNVWTIGTNPNDPRLGHFDGNRWHCIDRPAEKKITGNLLWSSGKNDVWLGTKPWHFDGENWQQVPIGEQYKITALWGTAPNNVFATAARTDIPNTGAILHYDGQVWQEMSSDKDTAELTTISGSGPDNIWAGGKSGAVLRFDGKAWHTIIESGAINCPITDITCPSFQLVYAVVGQCESSKYKNKIFKYDNTQWLEVSLPNNHGEECDPDPFCWDSQNAPCGEDEICADGGQENVLDCCDPYVRYTSIWAASDSELWAGTEIGFKNAARSGSSLMYYNGETWQVEATTIGGYYSVWGAGSNSVYVASDEYFSFFDGTSWFAIP